ncbi:MAG: PAS domain S-box protein, partial [Sedimentisphaerales bacterium]|nr:PAS domain S-box protein [Sedimentisphaerales bacterium]
MPRARKKGERPELAGKRKRRPAKLEPLHPRPDLLDQFSNNLAKFPDENPYPVMRIHKNGTLLYVNKASEPLLKAKGGRIGRPAPDQWHRLVKKALSSGQILREETAYDGRIFAFRIVPIAGSDYVNFYGLDITEQKEAQQEREITIKLLSLINSSNRMQELMKLVTVFLRDWSGCEAVGIRLQDGDDFPYYVTSGFTPEFVEAENKLCSVNEIGETVRDKNGKPFLECMCGNVISGRFDPSRPFFTKHGSFWTNSTTVLLASTTEADRLAKTRNRCNTAGYESLALVPLRAGGETLGLLQFNSKQRGLFTPEKISLLERLADNLAVGLAQRKAGDALVVSEKHFRTLADIMNNGLGEIDENGRYVYVNRKLGEILGYSSDKMFGRHWSEFFDSDAQIIIKAQLLSRKKGLAEPYEFATKRKDGRNIYIRLSPQAIYDAHGKFKGSMAVFMDITEHKQAEEKIKAERQRLYDVLETMPVMVCLLTTDYRVSFANRSFREKFGEARGRRCYEYCFGRSEPCDFCQTYNVLKTGKPHHWEITIPDGRNVIDVYDFPFTDIDGTPLILEMDIDITARKRLEENLEKERKELKLIIDSSPIIVFYKDKEGKFVRVNKAFAEAIGIPEEKFLGKTVFDFYSKQIAQTMTKDDQEVFGTGRPKLNIIEKYESAKGLRWVQTDKIPIFDKNGDIAGLVGFAQDITERKHAEQALRESERRFHSLFELSADAIVVFAPQTGEMVEFNNKAAEMLGYTREEFLNLKIPNIEAIESTEEVAAHINKIVRQTADTFETRQRKKDGTIIDVLVSTKLITIAGKQYVQGIWRNITEQRAAKNKLLENHKQLKKLAAQLALTEERERRRIARNLHDQVN